MVSSLTPTEDSLEFGVVEDEDEMAAGFFAVGSSDLCSLVQILQLFENTWLPCCEVVSIRSRSKLDGIDSVLGVAALIGVGVTETTLTGADSTGLTVAGFGASAD